MQATGCSAPRCLGPQREAEPAPAPAPDKRSSLRDRRAASLDPRNQIQNKQHGRKIWPTLILMAAKRWLIAKRKRAAIERADHDLARGSSFARAGSISISVERDRRPIIRFASGRFMREFRYLLGSRVGGAGAGARTPTRASGGRRLGLEGSRAL